MARHIEHRLRQDQPVGHHHHQVGSQLAQARDGLVRLERCGLLDGDAELQRALLDRARRERLPAAGGPVRLRVRRDQPVPGRVQRIERRHGEAGRAREDDAQRLGHGRGWHGGTPCAVGQMTGALERSRVTGELPRSRRSFSSFLRMRVRFSSER